MCLAAGGSCMGKSADRQQTLKEAWIGDAVLSLFVREKILNEDGKLDGEKCVRMTSNQFLAAFGEPSEVEAELGRVYALNGLQAAFAWIEARLLPKFELQEQKRLKRLGLL